MSQMNTSERSLEISERNIRSKLGTAIKTISAHTKTSVFALALGFASVAQAEDTPLGPEVGCKGGAQLASHDAKGAPCIDLSLSASEIQMKIDELEVRFDTLTEEELDVLFSYQDRLIDIERQQQAKNEAVIDAEIQETADSDERLKEKFEEISGFLDPDIRTKYPKLEEILSA